MVEAIEKRKPKKEMTMPRQKKMLEMKITPTDSDETTLILYQPVKGGRKLKIEEKLTLTFTNTGHNDIEFDAEKSSFVLYIHDAAKEFTDEEIKSFTLNSEISKAIVNWTLQIVKNGYNAIRLNPDQSFRLKANKSISLVLEGFKGEPNFVPRDLYVRTSNIKGARPRYERSIVVKQVQKEKKSLNLVANYIESNIIYISDSETLTTKNEQLFYLINIPKDNEPGTGKIEATKNAYIKISFDYGKGKGDIDKPKYAKDFKLSLYNTFENDYKNPEALKDSKNIYWKLRPRKDVFLNGAPNNRLALKFTDLCAHVPGIATLHIEYFNVKDTLDGYCSLDLVKTAPDFSIIYFGANDINIENGKKAELRWKVVSAQYATLQFKKYREIQTIATNTEVKDDGEVKARGNTVLGGIFLKKEGNRTIDLNQDKLFEIEVYEDTLFTLTAYGTRIVRETDEGEVNETYIRDQRQLYVSVVPTLTQFAMQCYYSEDDTLTAIKKCAHRYHLEKGTKEDLIELIPNLKSAGYADNDIYFEAHSYYYQNGENEEWRNNEDYYLDLIRKILAGDRS